MINTRKEVHTMATDKPKFTVILEPEVYDVLKKYWHQNELKSKSTAAAQLIKIGLQQEGFLKTKE